MKLLIDNALSPAVAKALTDSGHDAVHVRDLGMAASTDFEILTKALELDRIIISADTDFGELLAKRPTAKPSFILLRRSGSRRPAEQASVLLANLPGLVEVLELGCIAVLGQDRVRVRMLPIEGAADDG